MQLEIENSDNIDLKDFCEYLCTKLFIYAKTYDTSNSVLSGKWDDYITTLYRGEKHPTVQDIFQQYFSNIIYFSIGNNYVLQCDRNVKLKGFNESVDTLARLINYGTLDMQKYPVFDNVLDYFASNLDVFYTAWMRGA